MLGTNYGNFLRGSLSEKKNTSAEAIGLDVNYYFFEVSVLLK